VELLRRGNQTGLADDVTKLLKDAGVHSWLPP